MMFSYQTFVALILFITGLIFLLVKLKRWMRIMGQIMYAWAINKVCINSFIIVKPTKDKIFGCLEKTTHRPLKVVEIGAGTGANFKYLPDNTEVICVEPNVYFNNYLTANATQNQNIKVEFHQGVAEDMSFLASDSVDAVVCTHVLCGVTDFNQSLKEIIRILRKEGKFIFLEHIEAVKGSRLHFWQHMLKHMWSFLFHGCDLVRSTDVSIKNAGFGEVDIDVFELDFKMLMFQVVRRHCAGVATK